MKHIYVHSSRAGERVLFLHQKLVLIITVTLSALILPASLYAFDFSLWDRILKQNTRKSTYTGIIYTGVDYAAICNSKEFVKLVADLEAFSPDTLQGRDEKMAFWINTYNIFAVNLVRENFPVRGIKDVGSIFSAVWKHQAGKIGGKPYSLDYIEHKLLRPMNEPGIHFAIVCASVSCPDLRTEAYQAASLQTKLKSQLNEFLDNTEKGMKMDPSTKTVYLSKIFDWYEKDFEQAGGILNFINRNRGNSQTIPTDYSVKYLPYNWDLNSIR